MRCFPGCAKKCCRFLPQGPRGDKIARQLLANLFLGDKLSPNGLLLVCVCVRAACGQQVNLVGYSVGVCGVWHILQRFLQEPNYTTLIGSFAYMMLGAAVMLFLRRQKLCAP